jgi:DnaJ family protein C protein 17
MADISKINLYKLLDVDLSATEKEIISAYRKKALKCHPDKNPNNPKAAEEFHLLSKALQVLTDASARAAYNSVLKAKEAAELRHKQLDSKRKKLKDELEARERAGAAASTVKADKVPTKNLEAEIERLRKEGSSILEQEQQRLAEEIAREVNHQQECRLKVTWNVALHAYDRSHLNDVFEKYGIVNAIVVSASKPGSAIVEFANSRAALAALEGESDRSNPSLHLSWLSDKVNSKKHTKLSNKDGRRDTGHDMPKQPAGDTNFEDYVLSKLRQAEKVKGSPSPLPEEVCTATNDSKPSVNPNDFESVVMMKMRQAEERKRLIAQMENEDD